MGSDRDYARLTSKPEVNCCEHFALIDLGFAISTIAEAGGAPLSARRHRLLPHQTLQAFARTIF
jgi:hypothetical protein